MRKIIYFIIVVTLTTQSCNTTSVLPDKPNVSGNSYPRFPEFSQTSSIQLPISIPVKLVADELNSKIPNKIRLKNMKVDCPETPLPGESDCKIDGIVNLGDMQMSANGSILKVSTKISGSLNFNLNANWEVDAKLFKVKHRENHDKNVHFDGIVNLSSSPTIDYNWKIKPNLKGNINLEKADIHFGPKISVRSLLEEKLNPKFEKKLSEVNSQVANNINLKNKFTPYWKSLSQPIKINENPTVWVTLLPKKIYYNELNSRNNNLNLGIGLDFNLTTYIGSKPEKIKIGKLPSISKEKNSKNDFTLLTPLFITYEELNTIVNEKLANNELDLEDKVKITLSNIVISGDANNIFIETDFIGKHKLTKAEGKLYLIGKPELDLDNQTIKITDVQYTLQTRNLLVTIANWIFKTSLTKKIEEKSTFDIGKKIQSKKIELNKKFSNLTLDNKVILNGNLTKATIGNLYLYENCIVTSLKLEGTIKANVINLK